MGQQQQQQQDQGPPFMLPLVAGAVVAVLVCALWCAWRWYDRRARAGGTSTGEGWDEMRRAGVALGFMGTPFPGQEVVGPGSGVGRGRERERAREWEGREGRVRRGRAGVHAGEDLEEQGERWSETSSTSRTRNVGRRPKLWEVEVEIEPEDVRKVRCVLPIDA